MSELHDACRKRAPRDERLELPVEQGVLLWCMRMWVVEMKHGIQVETRVDDMLEALGVPLAGPCLKKLIFALSHSCTRMIEVQCVCQPQILVLRGFITQGGTATVLHAAEGIGTALTQAGRFLPEPEQEVRHFAITHTTPATLSGSLTLH